MSTFDKAFEELIDLEGGYSDHPTDRGGKTKYGITEKVARQNGYDGHMRDLPLETAKYIYKKRYWDYGGIADERIAIECFEQAVNMGVNRANMRLQKAYNLLSDREIAEDGIVGPMTITAVNNLQYPDELYKLLNVLQGKWYIEICESNPSQKVFLRGWLKRVEINK